MPLLAAMSFSATGVDDVLMTRVERGMRLNHPR
jgi:hypothetical protein